jgi:PAS domain S-box-containing protein
MQTMQTLEQLLAENERLSAELQELRSANDRANYYNLFRQMPEMVCVLAGPDHVFEFVNEAHVRALGFNATGLAVRVAQPESIEVHGILDEVYRTGVTADLRELPVTVTDRLRCFNLTYAARRDDQGNVTGVMILGSEVTSVVEARRVLEERARSLKDFLDAIPAILWSAGPDGILDAYNERWYEFTGASRGQIGDQGWAPVLPPEEIKPVGELWYECIRTGKPFQSELRFKHGQTGVYRWFLARAIPVRDEAGRITRWFGISTDIDQQKRAEEQVLNVLESMSDAFISLDKDWKILRINAQQERLTRVKREDIVGKSFIDVYFSTPEARANQFWDVYNGAMKDRQAVYVEDYFAPLECWSAVNVYPQPDGGLAFFHRDVTEEKRRQLELQQAIESRDMFMGIASHELKTPLTALRLQCQLNQRVLEKQGLGAFSRDRIEKLIEIPLLQVNRLARLVDDMLDISRIASGRLSMSFERMDLVPFLRQVFSQIAPQLENVCCESSLVVPQEAWVRADAYRFEQVLTNLATNAIKYAPGAPVEMVLSVDPRCAALKGNPAAVLRFRDHGPGIAPENLERVFKRFERLVSASNVSGLGLGMYISREVVKAHDGVIWVESDLGKGATFFVALPLILEMPI